MNDCAANGGMVPLGAGITQTALGSESEGGALEGDHVGFASYDRDGCLRRPTIILRVPSCPPDRDRIRNTPESFSGSWAFFRNRRGEAPGGASREAA